MTAFFPAFYPDELVFSACSRYDERMDYRSSCCSGRDLFRAPFARIAVDLPNSLADLCKGLPFGHSYTADRLLEQHTLYPIYAAFVSPQRAETLRRNMIETRRSVHAFAGALTIKLRSQFLRFCVQCASEDRKKWGETYWHRIHNVTGVEVCPAHNVFLTDSSIPIRRSSNREIFITAEGAIAHNLPEPAKSDDSTYGVLARELTWLLQQQHVSSEQSVTSNRYWRLLLEKGFATFARTVRSTKLEDALRAFYSRDLLRVLESEVEKKNSWIPTITQPHHRRSQPPYRHLLILNFLGCTLADFFSLPGASFQPFGQPPWPCLSRAATHYRKRVVKDCRVRMATDGTSRPVGIFKCKCGFAYSRLGPDETQSARFRFRIRAYGPVWIAKMKRLLFTECRSRKETALELGVCTTTVKNVLAKLPKSKTLFAERHKLPTPILRERRSQWLAAVKQNPNLSRNQIRDIVGNVVYDTLRRNDRKWFELHSPQRRKPCGNKPKTNWSQKDRERAAQVNKVVVEILETPGKPVRSSATLIARRLGVLEVTYKRPECLPITKSAIAAVAETVEDFAIRRIRWAADSYKRDGISFNAGQLKARAALSYSISENPRVAAVITAAVTESGFSDVAATS